MLLYSKGSYNNFVILYNVVAFLFNDMYSLAISNASSLDKNGFSKSLSSINFNI